MSNQYVNKVIVGGVTKIDISDTTAAAADVAEGKIFYNAAGARVIGTSTSQSLVIIERQDSHGGTIVDISADIIRLQSKTVTPTESAQTIVADTGYTGLSECVINPISSNYVGTGVARNDSDDLTVNGRTVSVPAGYYAAAASKSIAQGTAGTPSASKGSVSNHSIAITPSVTNVAGYITGGTINGTAVSVSASELVSGAKSITQNGTGIDVTNYATVNVAVDSGVVINNQSKTATPSENQQIITYDNTYTGLEKVTISAIANDYVGSAITRRSSTDLTVSSATVSVPAGYYASSASKSVATGTAGTPTASKGTVSNHAITVTPSVTNTAGYISSETKTGTGVSVSASELVSGSETKTANGTYDVTNLASLIVNVASGGGIGTLLNTTSIGTVSSTSTQAASLNVSCSVSNVNNYDLLIVESSVNTVTNGRHTCTIGLIFLTGSTTVETKNGATIATAKLNMKASSTGTTTTSVSTTAYGIYPNSCTVSNGIASIPMYRRYNSTSTGTINGTYTTRVYGVNLYSLIGG